MPLSRRSYSNVVGFHFFFGPPSFPTAKHLPLSNSTCAGTPYSCVALRSTSTVAYVLIGGLEASGEAHYACRHHTVPFQYGSDSILRYCSFWTSRLARNRDTASILEPSPQHSHVSRGYAKFCCYPLWTLALLPLPYDVSDCLLSQPRSLHTMWPIQCQIILHDSLDLKRN